MRVATTYEKEREGGAVKSQKETHSHTVSDTHKTQGKIPHT